MTDPNLLVGTETADDAAVYRLSADTALVQTVDLITPVVDDPYDYGAIAAANSISDIYAMGARPIFALNIVGFPKDCLPLTVLRDILRGGAEKAAEAGICVAGGHTVDDQEPKYGLSVTGVVHPEKVLTNAGARPGDVLILTKPLGSGIITTAAKNDLAPDEVVRNAVTVMATLNRAAAEVAAGFEIHACTDITGFGLLGHLHEMTSGSRVSARVSFSAIPFLPGALELAAQGLFPGGTHRNREALEGAVRWFRDATEGQHLLLCDAQTSGGLLFAAPAHSADGLVSALKSAGVVAATIGETTTGDSGAIEVVA